MFLFPSAVKVAVGMWNMINMNERWNGDELQYEKLNIFMFIIISLASHRTGQFVQFWFVVTQRSIILRHSNSTYFWFVKRFVHLQDADIISLVTSRI